MQAALGVSSPRSDHAALWKDIRDKGALPGSANATVTRAAIQAAVDALDPSLISQRSLGSWGQVYIPPDPAGYYIDGPIYLDQDSLELVGEGRASKISAAAFYHGPMFLMGIKRRPGGTTISTDHLLDAFGKLDSSAASGTGQRWGWWIKENGGVTADLVISQGNGPLAIGPQAFGQPAAYWADVTAFTIDFAIDWTGIGTHDGSYFGMSRQALPAPWFVYGALDTTAGTANFRLQFRTKDGTLDEGANGGIYWKATISVPATQALHRIAFQLVLSAGANAVLGFVDGVQVAVAVVGTNGNNATFATATGLVLCEATGYPFQVGPLNGMGFRTSSDGGSWTGTMERKVYGFKLSSGPRYVDGGAGQPWALTGGGTINDLNCYFSNTGATGVTTVAYFPFQDAPATVAGASGNRLVTVKTGSGGSSAGTTYAIASSPNSGSEGNSVARVTIRDLQVVAPASAYGEAFVLALAQGTTFRQATITAGGNAISSWNSDASYITHIRDCYLAGGNAAFYSFGNIATIDNCTITTQGRSSIWVNFSGQLTVRDLFLPEAASQTQYPIRLARGSLGLFDNVLIDNEALTPRDGAIYAEDYSDNFQPFLQLSNCTVALGTQDRPIITLHNSAVAGSVQSGRARIDSLTVQNVNLASAIVQVDGSGWYGEITRDSYPDVPVVAAAPGYAGPVKVQAIQHALGAPPRHSSWSRGGSRVVVSGPVDGQFGEWRCTGSGEYGTPTPPAWTGLAPCDEGVNGLAAYLVAHACWTAGNTPQRGSWTDLARAQILNNLLGGATVAAPATIYAGLSTGRASRVLGKFRELTTGTAPGYTRIGTAWGASSAGSAANSSALTWPTATGPWSGIRAITLHDALTGGNRIATIEVAPASAPLAVTAGNALAYAIGAVVVARTPHTPTRWSCWSPGTTDAANNYWLRAGAATTPATLYLALSTAPADPTGAPTEPVGGGYARVAFTPATQFATQAKAAGRTSESSYVHLSNATTLAFPAPSGPWGTAQSAYLMDAASGGNVVAAGNLTIPRALGSGATAPAFAPGALWIGCS